MDGRNFASKLHKNKIMCLHGNPVPSLCDASGGQETIPQGSSVLVKLRPAKYRTSRVDEDIVQTDGVEPCKSTAKAAVEIVC